MDKDLLKEETIEPRKSQQDAWDDVFTYAENLKCNWFLSRDIFNSYILPTAVENPELYAEWINSMVEVSGKKIKHPGLFKRSIKVLRKIKIAKRKGERFIRCALVGLFNSGIEEPDCAKNALKKIGYAL